MEEKNFGETLSVSQFKQKVGADTIKVTKSPKTEKVFFTWGGSTRGTVDHRLINNDGTLSKAPKEVVECLDENGQFSHYCLMKMSDANAVAFL